MRDPSISLGATYIIHSVLIQVHLAPHGGGGRMVQGHPVSEGKGGGGGGGGQGMARLLGHSLSSGDDVGHRNEFPIRLYLVKNNALP